MAPDPNTLPDHCSEFSEGPESYVWYLKRKDDREANLRRQQRDIERFDQGTAIKVRDALRMTVEITHPLTTADSFPRFAGQAQSRF